MFCLHGAVQLEMSAGTFIDVQINLRTFREIRAMDI